MIELLEILQHQEMLGLFVFGVGFSAITFVVGIFFMRKAKFITFKENNRESSTGNKRERELDKELISFKEFTRSQFAETRKVSYQMKQSLEVHDAVLEKTLQNFEKGIDNMVSILTEIKVEIRKFSGENGSKSK